MSKYENAKIYKLVSNFTEKVYYGSTIDSLPKRKSKHKYNYGKWLENKYGYTTSFELFKLGEVDIVLVEKFPGKDKYELFARERFYIDNNECLNKCNPFSNEEKRTCCDCGIWYNCKTKLRHEQTLHHINYFRENLIKDGLKNEIDEYEQNGN